MIAVKILVMSLVCFGAFTAIDTFLFKFFGKNREDIEERLSKWLVLALSPMLFCVYCAASFWGTLAYLGMGNGSLFEWMICVVGCCGLNMLIDNVKGLIVAFTEDLKGY